MLISLFSILNPILAITIYLDIARGMTKEDKKKIAITCALTVFFLLTGFLFIGEILLSMLSVHDYSIRIAGGLIVLLIGILMVVGSNEEKDSEVKNTQEQIYTKDTLISLGISPLALPMIVGPAAIVMVMLYGQEVHGIIGKIEVTSIIMIVSVLVFITFLMADYIAKGIGKAGIVVMTKIMGLLISAVAVEMIVDGLKDVVPILIKAAVA
jgi:multiple antibiotic resistance protein